MVASLSHADVSPLPLANELHMALFTVSSLLCSSQAQIIFVPFVFHGTPRGIRTPDLRFRKPSLYPTELWAHALIIITCRDSFSKRLDDIDHIIRFVKKWGFLITTKKISLIKKFAFLFLLKTANEYLNRLSRVFSVISFVCYNTNR